MAHLDERADQLVAVLYVALELSAKTWMLAFSVGGKIRRTKILAGNEALLLARIAAAKEKSGLPADAPVVSCYEAGRDGFWVHRFLTTLGFDNVVVDAASMKVNRRHRRAKTDRIDADQLVRDLMRHHRGERDVWSVVRVPSLQQEDDRLLHRGLQRLKKEKTQVRGRILSLLATQGIRVKSLSWVLKNLDDVRTWEGKPLPPGLRAELGRLSVRLGVVVGQVRAIIKEQEELLKDPTTPALQKIQRLAMLRGIGVDSAWLLTMEAFAWREFKNRRQVGGMAGMGGTPYSSGDTSREQGISKAGNVEVRTRMVELAWQWLRHQPQSHLSQWYIKNFATGAKRRRRTGIVAMGRRLLVDLWRYVEFGIMPRGALLKDISGASR